MVCDVEYDGVHDVSEKSETDFLWLGRLGLSYGRKEYISSSGSAKVLAVGVLGFFGTGEGRAVAEEDADEAVAEGGGRAEEAGAEEGADAAEGVAEGDAEGALGAAGREAAGGLLFGQGFVLSPTAEKAYVLPLRVCFSSSSFLSLSCSALSLASLSSFSRSSFAR